MSVRCTARTSAGDECQRWAVEGARVCPSHGGNAPQTRAAAERRVLELVGPALAQLAAILDTKPATPQEWNTMLKAIHEVLDRAGLVVPPSEFQPITREHLEWWLTELETAGALDNLAEVPPSPPQGTPPDPARAASDNRAWHQRYVPPPRDPLQ